MKKKLRLCITKHNYIFCECCDIDRDFSALEGSTVLTEEVIVDFKKLPQNVVNQSVINELRETLERERLEFKCREVELKNKIASYG